MTNEQENTLRESRELLQEVLDQRLNQDLIGRIEEHLHVLESKKEEPEQWKPKRKLISVSEKFDEPGGTMTGHHQISDPWFRYLRFWWNVRQLVQEFDGGEDHMNGAKYYAFWSHAEEWVSRELGFMVGVVGPFWDQKTAQKACEILNSSDWSKGGVPR